MKRKVSLYYNQITIKLQSDYNRVTISCIIVYILEAHSTSSSLKKKKNKGERQNERKEKERKGKERKEKERKEKERKEVEKRRRRKRDGKSLVGRKERWRMRGGRKDEDEEEGEGKEEEKEKHKMEKAIHEMHRPLQKIFPSTKLGNNMTPIKGRLGKNTTPTSNNPMKLNQNLQTNSQQR